jgi:endonuclease YncB( thermonuclease family)
MSPRPFLPLRPALLLAFFLLPLAAHALEWVGTVVGIADGDTLTLLGAGKTTHRIRIEGIDAPERTQAYGQRARQSLADLLQGRTAHADCPKNDRYGRAVCRVTVDGVDVGLEQIRRGLAWHYKNHAYEQSIATRISYASAEEQARAKRVGLWAMPSAEPPWEYRRERSTAPK